MSMMYWQVQKNDSILMASLHGGAGVVVGLAGAFAADADTLAAGVFEEAAGAQAPAVLQSLSHV